MHRVARQNEEDCQRREVEQVLHGVHREPRPRSRGDVAVVDRVHPQVERLPVQRPVDDEEVCALPHGEQREQQHEPDGMAREVELDEDAPRVHHARQDLPGGRDGRGVHHRPEHVVPGLITQEEARPPAPGRIRRVVLEGRALATAGVKPQVQPAGNDRQRHRIAQKHRQHPVRRQHGLSAGHRLQPQADEEREEQEEHSVGGPEEIRRHPCHNRRRPRGPVPPGHARQRQGRMPVPGRGQGRGVRSRCCVTSKAPRGSETQPR